MINFAGLCEPGGLCVLSPILFRVRKSIHLFPLITFFFRKKPPLSLCLKISVLLLQNKIPLQNKHSQCQSDETHVTTQIPCMQRGCIIFHLFIMNYSLILFCTPGLMCLFFRGVSQYVLHSFEHMGLCKSAIFLSLCLVLSGQWLDHKIQGHRERLIETRCLLPAVEIVNMMVWFKGGMKCR